MILFIGTVEDGVNSNLQKVIEFRDGRSIYADLKDTTFDFMIEKGIQLYIYGNIFYYLQPDGNIKLIDLDSKKYLKRIFSDYSLKEIVSTLEGQYVGLLVDRSKGEINLFCDRYARIDTFYTENNSDVYFATDLDILFRYVKPVYDQKMLANFFLTYGWYTPKGSTIYKNIKQLRVGEIITLSESGMRSETIDFKPLEIDNYTNEDLNVYYNILKESIVSRANQKGELWVSSSSGWDSSIILGILVNEFGSEKVRMLTGRLEYSESTDVINKFEMNKIVKIGEYYGIKPIVIDFDLKSKTASDYWQKVLPFYRSRHIYSYSTYNFTKLSDGLNNTSGQNQIIFNGETSDSFHNFGFSQFGTFFHTDKSFTEYADKMNCYLYGPSFLKKVLDNAFENDKVYQIFKRMMPGVEFVSGLEDKKEVVNAYLFPFFYGSPRIPFAKTYNNPVLTAHGQSAIYNFPFKEYIPDILSKLTEHNIYSWLIYLYHSFFSQGSTVNAQKHAMEMNNHQWRCPFNDIRLINHLSRAPEKWGRGLDLNNTKYPLKWVALNKIKFPYNLLEEGPHSYLYDIIEGFSLLAEITYRSGVTELFKDKLNSRRYKNILDGEYFDLSYIDNLATCYLNGDETKGQDFNNLVSLITLCSTDWY